MALAAALHFDVSTPNFMIQEAFGEFDVPWRNAARWRLESAAARASSCCPTSPGLGLELDLDAIAEHPYVAECFRQLVGRASGPTKFTQSE